MRNKHLCKKKRGGGREGERGRGGERERERESKEKRRELLIWYADLVARVEHSFT